MFGVFQCGKGRQKGPALQWYISGKATLTPWPWTSFLGSLTLFPCPGSLSTHITPGRGQNGSDALTSIHIKEAWVQYSSSKACTGRSSFPGKRWGPCTPKRPVGLPWARVGQILYVYQCRRCVGVFWEICVADGSWGHSVCAGGSFWALVGPRLTSPGAP